jgi:DNA-binding transcriptional LysR family regulator
MKISLSQARFLLAVDDAGSISEAARRLGMTQSGLSQGLIAMERALGAALLARSRDGVALTALGHSVITEARIISNAIERIEKQAEFARSAVKTVLRIASVPSVAKSLLPGWRLTFQRLYPETDVTVLEGHHIEVSDWVGSRDDRQGHRTQRIVSFRWCRGTVLCSARRSSTIR